MLSTLVITSINHVLRNEQWACKRLQSFSGQTADIQISPLINLKILINSIGEILKMNDSMETDVTIILPSLMHPNLLTREPSFEESIQVIGDQSLANTLIEIGKQLSIGRLVEHDLSKVIGDIPAHRFSRAGQHFFHWHAENFNALSQALAEYLTEEKPILAKHDAINQLILEMQNLQFQVDAIEQRVNNLIASMNAVLSEKPTS